MKNVVHTAIRAAGRDSTVRNCTVVMDTEDWDSRNEKIESQFDGKPIQLNRAIWAQTNDKRFAGPVIEDCDIIIKNTTSIAMADDPRKKAEEIAAPVLDRARKIADEHGHEITTTVGYGAPAREIVNRAEEFDAVVIGSHGGTLRDRLIVGDVAKTVFNRSPVPVTVVR